jgi:hypothetical protein
VVVEAVLVAEDQQEMEGMDKMVKKDNKGN